MAMTEIGATRSAETGSRVSSPLPDAGIGELAGKRVSQPVRGAIDAPPLQSAPRVADALPEHPIRDRALATGPAASAPGALNGDTALAPATKLANYLHNGLEAGAIPRALQADLETAIEYAGHVDRDLDRLAELTRQSAAGPLSRADAAEAETLAAANKHNLGLVSGWLASKGQALSNAGPETGALFEALRNRFADRHMDLADLMCLHDITGDGVQQGVSRRDRIAADALRAAAAVQVAERLDVPGLPREAQARLVETLKSHCAELERLRDLAGPTGQRLPQEFESLQLTSHEDWANEFKLVKQKKGEKSDIAALQAHWTAKAAGATDAPWLPQASPKVGQTRMLTEFVKHQLNAAGVARNAMPNLKLAFQQAGNRVMNEQAWDPIEKQVRFEVGGGEGQATSTITPGKALAGRFAEPYAGNGINCADRLQYRHVPNLATTALTGPDGRTLFSGLRHGVLDAYDLTAGNLARLPDAEVRQLAFDLLTGDSADDVRNAHAGDIVKAMRQDPSEAARLAGRMRTSASRNMAEELAVSALVGDPAKLRRALSGETVEVSLSSISLLTPDSVRALKGNRSNEKAMLAHQTQALRDLAAGSPLTLKLRDENGRLANVKVDVNVRTFNFGVNGGAVGKMFGLKTSGPVLRNLMGWGLAMGRNNPELRKLVGPSRDSGAGGDVAHRLRNLAEMRERLSIEKNAAPTPAEAEAVQARIDGLDRDRIKLRAAAEQLKDIWRSGDFRRGGSDPYKMVSRLALVSHLLGETPAFNCKSGKDRTGQLDAEVKHLAAVSEYGPVPRPGRSDVELRKSRGAFTMNTGNLEMQRLNVGLPGFKLEWGQVPGLRNLVADDAMESAYRGGSKFVSS